MKREQVINLSNPTVELIKSYTFTPSDIAHDSYQNKTPERWAELCSETGGFNPYTKELTPLRYQSADVSMYEALDHITAAVEAGIVDINSWAAQLFVDDEELEAFFDELEGYDQCYRISDRWWSTIAKLVGSVDEEGLITCEEIVSALRDSIEEGAQRREFLTLESNYFAEQPAIRLGLSDVQRDALEAHNARTMQSSLKMGVQEDVSLRFRFPEPFLEFSEGRLTARQATVADVAALMAKASKKKA